MITINNQENEIIERNGHGYKPIEDYGEDDLSEDISKFDIDFKSNKFLVKEILESWDKATNNDVLLYFEFLRWKFQDIKVTSSKDYVIFKFPKKQVKYFPSPESVTRCRRRLNELGLCLPSNPIVFENRMKRQKVIRKYFKSFKG